MSSQTPNINLTLPVGSEKVRRQIINENNTKIDTAIGSLNDSLANKSITWNSIQTNSYGEVVTTWNISKYKPTAFRVTVNSSLVHSGWAVTTGGDIIVYAYDRSTGASLANTTIDILMWYM